MKKQYAIFSDVDGTIYSDKQVYHPKVKDSIREAQEKGIEFIICTGNPYFDNMQKMSKDLNVDYFIGANGAYIFDVKNNKEIKVNTIPKEMAQKILDIITKHGLGADWWDSENMYVNKYTPQSVKDKIRQTATKSKGFIEQDHVDNDVQKMELFVEENHVDIEKIDKLCVEFEKFGLQLARMKPYHLEITNPASTKGEAVKSLSKHLGLDLENIMTIGDSPNDHSMLKVTPFSYAMGNADELTQQIANYYTSSVEQNGLGEAIVDFMFRKRLTDNFKNQK